jgi:hypothetical protein
MLWLQAIYFQNPLEVMQRAREQEEIKKIFIADSTKRKTLQSSEVSWPNGKRLNEIQAGTKRR